MKKHTHIALRVKGKSLSTKRSIFRRDRHPDETNGAFPPLFETEIFGNDSNSGNADHKEAANIGKANDYHQLNSRAKIAQVDRCCQQRVAGKRKKKRTENDRRRKYTKIMPSLDLSKILGCSKGRRKLRKKIRRAKVENEMDAQLFQPLIEHDSMEWN
mmetsp:Transcript_26327/g.26709  ORF Transcript_26327/g.26709 Transcript_26327/m.26709 type:complete len:158 (-) Transcript_26327:115-588(-)